MTEKLDVRDTAMPSFEVIAGTSVEEIGINLKDMMGNMFQGRTKTRRLRVPEALENLVDTYGEEVRNVSAVRTAIVNPGGTRTRMRAQAYPGENPATLKAPDVVAGRIVEMLVEDFETGARLRLASAA